MSEAPKTEKVAPTKIAEVQAFLKAKAALDDLQRLYPKAFAELLELAPVYNATLKAADAVVRAKGVTCGPFELYQYAQTFDAAILYEAVGRQRFPSCGGIIETTETHTIDKARFVALAAAGKIDRELAERVQTWAPRYHKPEPISVPT